MERMLGVGAVQSQRRRFPIRRNYFDFSTESRYVVSSGLVQSCGPMILRSRRPLRSMMYVSGYIVVP